MNDTPKQVEWSATRVDGVPGHRLMVILAAPGCAWAAKTGGCSNCSFPGFFGVGGRVSTAEYLAQLAQAAAKIPLDTHGAIAVDLFVSGSFFNPDEVPEDAQVALVARAGRIPGVRHILVETRPEYVTRDRVAGARDAASGARLEVAVGLETADDEIRNHRIRKGFSWQEFAAAARILADEQVAMMTHLLLKPIDTPEREAIEDLIASATKVFALGRALSVPTRVGVQPCFVAPATAVERAFDAHHYRPPWLWSVVEVVCRVAPLGAVHVGLSDEGMGPKRVAHNCDACSDAVRGQLTAFNCTQDTAALARLDCTCKAEWQGEI